MCDYKASQSGHNIAVDVGHVVALGGADDALSYEPASLQDMEYSCSQFEFEENSMYTLEEVNQFVDNTG